MNFAKVYEIFPELGTDMLCLLSELEDILPSKVHQLVPEASAVQIAAFLQLAENTVRKKDKIGKNSRENLEDGERLEMNEPVSPIGSVKGSSAEDAKVGLKVKSPTVGKTEFWDQLKKLIPPDDGGNVNRSIKFTEQFETKILNLLEAAKPKDRDSKLKPKT